MTHSEAIKLVRERKLPYCYQVLFMDHSVYVGSSAELRTSTNRLEEVALYGPIREVAMYFSNQPALVRLMEAAVIQKYWDNDIILINESPGWVHKYQDWKHYIDPIAWFIK